MGDVERPLTLSDLRQHAPDLLERHQVLAAAQHPSVPAFRRALEELDSANAERFLHLVDVAREQCAGSGKSDLRRLKRQFSTLKNTFLHYDVKEAFIDALSEGCPDGSEAERLAEYEQEVQQYGEIAKQHKADNEKARTEVESLGQRVSAAFAAYQRDRDGVLAELAALETELSAPAADVTARLPPLEPGPEEDECKALMQQETTRTRDLEAQIAVAEAAAAELATLATCERDEVGVQQARMERLRCAKGRAEKRAQVATRFACAEACEYPQPEQLWQDWAVPRRAEAQAATLAELGGVTVASVDEDALLLRLTTAEATADAGVASADHLLTLKFQDSTTRLASAALVPDSVSIADAVREFCDAPPGEEAGLPLSALVQEVQRRIGENLMIQCSDETQSV